jgi:DNA-directed RNA polymerase subunit RPC12/RpoP
MSTDASLTYVCSACGASTAAVVTDLQDPKAFVEERYRNRYPDIAPKLLQDSAKQRLRFATCPRCGVRNPEGLAAQAADQRQNRAILLAMIGLGTLGAWFAPKVALVIPGLMVFQSVLLASLSPRFGRPVPWRATALSLTVSIVLVAAVLRFPRFAFLVPVVVLGPALLRGRGSVDNRWEEASRTIRFELE